MKYVTSGPVYILDIEKNGETLVCDAPSGAALHAAATFAKMGHTSHFAGHLAEDYTKNCIGSFMSENNIIFKGDIVQATTPHYLMDITNGQKKLAGMHQNIYLDNYAQGFMLPRAEDLTDSLEDCDGLYLVREADETFFKSIDAINDENGFEVMWQIDDTCFAPEWRKKVKACAALVDGVCMNFNQAIKLVGVGSYSGAIAALEAMLPCELFVLVRSDCLTVLYQGRIAQHYYSKNALSGDNRVCIAASAVLASMQKGNDLHTVLKDAVALVDPEAQ